MFGRTQPVIDDGKLDALAGEIRELTGRVAALHGEKDYLEDRNRLAGEVETLTKSKTAKEIELDRVVEKHARETREIEHKLGLHKQQVDLEIRSAKRETELDVREQALQEQRDRFEEHMEFQRERFQGEIDATRGLMQQILERLPTVTVERKYETVETIGDKPAPRRKALTK